MPRTAELPAALAEATEHQPRARAALAAALTAGPAHAYLFRGPRGAGKRTVARAFAAELLAQGAPDPDAARRMALARPPAHPDLVWLEPPGAQHLVDDVRAAVIRGASLRPAYGERRSFVIAAAEAMRDESQNALLKTLEEPAPFAHLILVCSEPEALLPTIISRCQEVHFIPLPPEAIARSLGDGEGVDAAARLAGGDAERARLLTSEEGGEIRVQAERAARGAVAGAQQPWREMLQAAEESGRRAGAEVERRLREHNVAPGKRRLPRELGEQVRRAERRARTDALDLGLALCCAWYRDLAALAEGAPELVLNSDRAEELSRDAEIVEPQAARSAVELVLDTRRRLRVNVSEELALEALWFRLSEVVGG